MNTKSCGCIKRDRILKINKEEHPKQNKYIIKDGYVECYDDLGKSFLIDIEDLYIIKESYWRVHSNNCVMNGRDKRFIHREILKKNNDIKNKSIDHINHNRTNNRKSNLRICTQAENMRNRKLPSNNNSGFIGVTWNKNRNRWMTFITVNKIRKTWLFKNKEDAIEKRIWAEKEYFGEFAIQRDLL